VTGVLVALAVGSAMSGCSDSAAQPKPLRTTSPSAASTPTSAASTASSGPTTSAVHHAPAVPAAARGTGPASAEAFVHYWVQLLNRASATGQTRSLQSLSHACASCDAVVTAIDQVYTAGGHIESRGWQIMGLKWRGAVGKPTVEAKIHLTPQFVTKKRGVDPVRYKGGRLIISFHLFRGPHGWRVAEVER
jgi:hypothetical protein